MEFSIHVGLAIAAARSLMEADTTAQDSELSTPSHTTLSHKKAYKTEGSSLNRGVLLTSAGPAALPPTGNILDDPDLVWTEVASAYVMCLMTTLKRHRHLIVLTGHMDRGRYRRVPEKTPTAG